MTELTWLVDLIVNHELSPKTKKHVLKRMKQVELNYQQPTIIVPQALPPPKVIHGAMQSPSTVAAMQRHQDIQASPQAPIAVTPQAQAAIASRQAMIEQALSGKVDKGHTSPPKAHAVPK